PLGQILCIDWQWSRGCLTRDHDQCHKCSGTIELSSVLMHRRINALTPYKAKMWQQLL
ncbi:hypothetical protein L208DRAFT_1044605, partial [Tricholoma matsutake]